MTDDHGVDMHRVLRALRKHALLLQHDAILPSVSMLIAGEPVRGSWWAHPTSHAIYQAELALKESRDVVVAKLISGKDTYVYRRLWPALLTVATAREAWQLHALSNTAFKLLAAVDASGELRTDDVPSPGSGSVGNAARELERRLLVRSDEVHTERGAHAKRLETWRRWARRAGAAKGRMSAAQGRRQIEEALAAMAPSGAGGRLPWQGRER